MEISNSNKDSRSYIVTTASGQSYQRNRRHLKKGLTTHRYTQDEEDENIDNGPIEDYHTTQPPMSTPESCPPAATTEASVLGRGEGISTVLYSDEIAVPNLTKVIF